MRQEMLFAIIAQALDQEQAQKAVEAIVREWGGSLEWIPTGASYPQQRAERNHAILSLYRVGVGISELAERYGVSKATIRRALGNFKSRLSH